MKWHKSPDALGIIARLPEARRNALVAKGADVFEPTPGRELKDYVVAALKIVESRAKLRALLSEALAHASLLTAQPKKSTKPSATKNRATTPTRRAARARKKALVKKRPASNAVAANKKAKRRAGATKRVPARSVGRGR
jgi:hypothetical protein